MEIMQLRYFLVVAEEENLSNAARKLFISQPALSRSISKLEAELGVKLFHHSSNRITLNENGRAFQEHVRRAEQELQNGVSMLQQRQDRESGYVVVSTSSHGVMAKACADYLQAHPKTHLMQYIQSAEQMEVMLRKRRIDFCLTANAFESPDLQWQPIMDDEILVYVHRDHPLANRRLIHFDELKDQRIIIYDYGLETTDVIRHLCYASHFEPDLFFAGNENEVPFLLLNKNLGVFILPASMHYFHMSPVMPGNRAPIRTLRVQSPRHTFTLGLASLKDRVLSGTADQFRSFLIDFFRQQNDALQAQLARDFPLDPPEA